jgi:hypothetical protein
MQDSADSPEITSVEAEVNPGSGGNNVMKRPLRWLPIKGYGIDGDLFGPDPELRAE